jgi:hypothetical protein
MTSQRHPDATALAEYKAGLTGGRRARRLAAHMASCASCASVNDQLAAVTAVLASAPEPAMPDAVESRIIAALATEAAPVTETPHDTEAAHGTAAKRDTALRPVGGGDGGGSRRRPGGGRPGPGNRWLRPAVLASAAAACLVLVGGVYGIAHLSSGSSSSSAASSAAGTAAAGSESSPLAGAQAPGTHTRLEPADSGQAAFAVTASGTNYQSATLAQQVRAQLARPAKTAASPAAAAAPSAQLSACVLHLTGQMRPSLVDRATYQGKPAYVIAVTNWAWVVGTGCTASNPELIASVGL